MISKEDVRNILNNTGDVIGADGEKIGQIGQFYLNDQSGEPEWLTVRTDFLSKTGVFSGHQPFIPLNEARVEGNNVITPYSKEQVTNAPEVHSRSRLSPEEEQQLLHHYRSGRPHS